MGLAKKFTLILLFLISISFVSAGTVTRSFSSNSVVVGNEVSVNLNVNVGEGDNVYAIQENVPENAEITDTGSLIKDASSNTLRFIKFSNLEDIVLIYKIKFSNPGTYVFPGEYAFNDYGEADIGGEASISVSSSGNGGDGGDGGDGGNGGGGGGGCTENWRCSDWDSCINNEQTRTCSDLNRCGTTRFKPITTQNCVIETCSNGETRACPNQNGVCSGSIEICTSGIWQGCNYFTISEYEANEVSCDNKDNNCNSQTDEGCGSPWGKSVLYIIIIVIILIIIIIVIVIGVLYKRKTNINK